MGDSLNDCLFSISAVSLICMHVVPCTANHEVSDYIKTFLNSLKKVVAQDKNCGNINEPLIRSVNTIHTKARS